MMKKCERCEAEVEDFELTCIEMPDGSTQEWCHDCVIDNAWQCPNCEDWFARGSDQYAVNYRRFGETRTVYWCQRCYESDTWVCDRCDETWSDDDASTNVTVRDGSHEEWCPDCVENHTWECHHCERTYSDQVRHCRCQDADYMHEVIGWHDFDGEYIPRKANEKDESLYFGLEVETGEDVEVPFDRLERWLDSSCSPLIHFETDGSIEGPEMITQPCTLEYHQRKVGWKELCRTLISAGMRSHECRDQEVGLHIHISRRNDLMLIMRKLEMHIANDKETWARIGRRRKIYGSIGWNNLWKPRSGYYMRSEANSFSSRYHPLNFNPKHTVELRTPRGTLNPETILGTVEWVHAVIHALKYVSVSELMPMPETPETQNTAEMGCEAAKKLKKRYAPDITREVIMPYIWSNKGMYAHCIAMMARMWAHQTVRPVLVTKEIKKAEWLANHEPGVKKQKIRR